MTRAIIPRLEKRFEVIETRKSGEQPTYPARIQQAMNERAEALRKPTLPTIILETHQALHAGEWARWQESETYDALAAALIEALERAIP